jgi:translation initiation factor 1
MSSEDLKSLAKDLKRLCSVGGAVKDFVIVLQGDHRERVVQFLTERGFKVLRAGG